MSLGTIPPSIETYVEADIKCYLCGTLAGAIECDRERQPNKIQFRAAGASQPTPIADVRQIHCPRCGGATFLDEVTVLTRRVERLEWLEDRPRRGRPPKRLVEQRRREQEALQTSAA